VIRLIYIFVFAVYIVFLALLNENTPVTVSLMIGKSWQCPLRLALLLFVLIGVAGTLVGGLIDHFHMVRKNKTLRKQLEAQTQELASLREMVTLEQDPR